jgi:hypothetical protein
LYYLPIGYGLDAWVRFLAWSMCRIFLFATASRPAQPASYKMDTEGFFPEGKAAGA